MALLPSHLPSLLPRNLFLAAIDAGLYHKFDEADRPGPSVITPDWLQPRIIPSTPRGRPPAADATVWEKAEWAVACWEAAHPPLAGTAWRAFSKMLSEPEWEEYWRGYPYTHGVREACRKYAIEAGMHAELAQLEASEPEMQALLDAARPTPEEARARLEARIEEELEECARHESGGSRYKAR